MQPFVFRARVSNLVPEWSGERPGAHPTEAPVDHGVAAAVVEHAMHATERRRVPRRETPARSAFSHEVLLEPEAALHPLADDAPSTTDIATVAVALPLRDVAREALRARLLGVMQQRELRSAYEIVFIMLAAAVAVLLAAPPLVQVLLAAHGVST